METAVALAFELYEAGNNSEFNEDIAIYNQSGGSPIDMADCPQELLDEMAEEERAASSSKGNSLLQEIKLRSLPIRRPRRLQQWYTSAAILSAGQKRAVGLLLCFNTLSNRCST